MNRRNIIRALIGLSVLYVLILISTVFWFESLNRKNDWLIEKEANPTAAPLPNIVKDDWVAVLANPAFASKSLVARIAIANQHFEKIRDLASEQGYDLRALQMWYQRTARDFERYPVKTFVFAQNVKTDYRDLSDSEFPKPSFAKPFWFILFSKDVIPLGLIALPIVVVSLFVVGGTLIAVFSKSLSFRWRTLVCALVLIIVAEAWLVRTGSKQSVSLGLYNFYDGGSYLSAEGTWSSDTKLAAPLQTTKIVCWQSSNQCIEATAQLLENNLRVYVNSWDVKEWLPNEIRFSDDNSSLCRIDSLRIDRKGKLVTATNVPKQPISDFCKSMGDDPIVTHLVDGFKLQYKD